MLLKFLYSEEGRIATYPVGKDTFKKEFNKVGDTSKHLPRMCTFQKSEVPGSFKFVGKLTKNS